MNNTGTKLINVLTLIIAQRQTNSIEEIKKRRESADQNIFTSRLDHGCTCIGLSRFRYMSGITGIAVVFQVWFLPFRQSLPIQLSDALYTTHYHVAGLLKGEVHVAISMQLGVDRINLIWRVSIRGFHGGRGDVGVGGTLLVAVTLLLSLLLWRRRGVLGPGGIVSYRGPPS